MLRHSAQFCAGAGVWRPGAKERRQRGGWLPRRSYLESGSMTLTMPDKFSGFCGTFLLVFALGIPHAAHTFWRNATSIVTGTLGSRTRGTRVSGRLSREVYYGRSDAYRARPCPRATRACMLPYGSHCAIEVLSVLSFPVWVPTYASPQTARRTQANSRPGSRCSRARRGEHDTATRPFGQHGIWAPNATIVPQASFSHQACRVPSEGPGSCPAWPDPRASVLADEQLTRRRTHRPAGLPLGRDSLDAHKIPAWNLEMRDWNREIRGWVCAWRRLLPACRPPGRLAASRLLLVTPWRARRRVRLVVRLRGGAFNSSHPVPRLYHGVPLRPLSLPTPPRERTTAPRWRRPGRPPPRGRLRRARLGHARGLRARRSDEHVRRVCTHGLPPARGGSDG